jgi:hypothetical protein
MLVKDIFKVVQNVVARWNFLGGFLVPMYTTATRPKFGVTDKSVIIFVTDATPGGGGQWQGWDGTAWRNLG